MLSTHQMIIEALRGGGGSSKRNEEYGIELDEMQMLSAVPDLYDVAEFNGPDPPIAHFLPGPVPYTNLLIGREATSLTILQMSYNMIMPGYTVIFTGKRRSGKTKVMRALCRHNRRWYPEVIVFTRTKSSGEYARFLPDARIIQGFDPDLLIEIARIQRQKVRDMSNGLRQDENINILIILDDCLAERLQWSQELNAIFFEGRHLFITLFVSIQDVKGCAPAATGNCDYAFLFPTGDERTFEAVRDKYMPYLDKYELKDLLDDEQINKKYHIIGVDIAHKYNDINERVSLGCVDEDLEEEDFVMGSPQMWKDDRRRLKQLGYEHLIGIEDWGILKPSEYKTYVESGCPIFSLKTFKIIKTDNKERGRLAKPGPLTKPANKR